MLGAALSQKNALKFVHVRQDANVISGELRSATEQGGVRSYYFFRTYAVAFGTEVAQTDRSALIKATRASAFPHRTRFVSVRRGPREDITILRHYDMRSSRRVRHRGRNGRYRYAKSTGDPGLRFSPPQQSYVGGPGRTSLHVIVVGLFSKSSAKMPTKTGGMQIFRPNLEQKCAFRPKMDLIGKRTPPLAGIVAETVGVPNL